MEWGIVPGIGDVETFVAGADRARGKRESGLCVL